MNKCYILVGVPGSGKSTWIDEHAFDSDTVIASTDDYVEREASRQGKTYSEVFTESMPGAVKHMADSVIKAVASGHDIVWDQTSTTVATRAKKLRMLPESYQKIAVVFKTPERAELARRLASRPGKTIPDQVMHRMIGWWEEPTVAEGFDKIIHVGQEDEYRTR